MRVDQPSRAQPVVEVVAPEPEDMVSIGMNDEELSVGDAVVQAQTDDLRGHQPQHGDPAELVAGDRLGCVRRPNVRYSADEYDLSHVFVTDSVVSDGRMFVIVLMNMPFPMCLSQQGKGL